MCGASYSQLSVTFSVTDNIWNLTPLPCLKHAPNGSSFTVFKFAGFLKKMLLSWRKSELLKHYNVWVPALREHSCHGLTSELNSVGNAKLSKEEKKHL